MMFRQNELSKLPFKLFKNLNPTEMWSIYSTPHLKRNTLIQEINSRREKTHFRKLLDKTCAVKFPASVKWILEAILSMYDDLKRKHLHPRHCSHPPSLLIEGSSQYVSRKSTWPKLHHEKKCFSWLGIHMFAPSPPQLSAMPQKLADRQSSWAK